MNKKAQKSLQSDGMGIIMIFIGAIIALVFLSSIADSVFSQTTTRTVINDTVIVASVANGTTDLTGRTLLVAIEFYNATGNPAETGFGLNSTATLLGNLSLITGISTTGLVTVQLATNDTTAVALLGSPVNVSYTYEPDGFLNSSGSRAVILLVVIFGALAIVIFIIAILFKNGALGEIIRRG